MHMVCLGFSCDKWAYGAPFLRCFLHQCTTSLHSLFVLYIDSEFLLEHPQPKDKFLIINRISLSFAGSAHVLSQITRICRQ